MKSNIFGSRSTCMEVYCVCLYINHHTKTTVVCCNTAFHCSSSCMDHCTSFHVSVGLSQARPKNIGICKDAIHNSTKLDINIRVAL